jgi:uncharacterized protein (DUF952 family)
MAASAWALQRATTGPPAADQFERHGFVHCCTREQILEIASWWLAADAPLVAIEIDASVAGDVRFERADRGREYPHIYNAIPRDAVVTVHNLNGDARSFALPRALSSPAAEFAVTGVVEGREARVRWRDGAFVEGDEEVITRASTLVDKGEDVPQFPGVTRPASTDTPYDAFCLLAAVLDEVTTYRGDGFID